MALRAKQVFATKFHSESLFDIPAISVEWPTDLEFSRFPASIRIAIQDSSSSKPGLVLAILVTTRFGNEYLYDTLPSSDNTVIDNTWYPFDAEDYKIVASMWDKAGGNKSGNMTLSQYVALAAHPHAQDYIVDKAASLQAVLPSLIDTELNETPAGLKSSITLYPYQLAGWRWLKKLRQMGLGAMLADEMGLGKTLQIIALLADTPPSNDAPALIIMPSSLLANWEKELIRFASNLTYIRHQGADRVSNFRELQRYNIVLSTYDLLWSDLSVFEQISWSVIILDEAHYIKNPIAQRTRALTHLKKAFGIAVTGTPIQNSLRDAWSLFDFILPGYCGSIDDFSSRYEDTMSDALHLAPRLTPFMLRRTVKEVANDLPPLIMIPQPIEMSETEALIYDELRRDIVANVGGQLAAIVPLRQLCCHPRLRDERWENVDITQSNKFKRLAEILLEIRQQGDKCLIFTTYNKMASIISGYVAGYLNLPVNMINGETPINQRQPIIEAFSKINGSAALILNPAAGGVGLNIQAANHVIHYNLEWNPAVEDQATARSYRRGQSKPVTVHRLYYQGTIEEVMDARLALKRGLIDHAVKGVKGDSTDIALALQLSPRMSHHN